MQDLPDAEELLAALESFLGQEVVPRLEGGLRFQALVAANVAGIVRRELALGPVHDRAQLARLRALLPSVQVESQGGVAATVRELSFELCRRIDAGDADRGPWRREVLEHLRRSVEEKLAVDNPKAAATESA